MTARPNPTASLLANRIAELRNLIEAEKSSGHAMFGHAEIAAAQLAVHAEHAWEIAPETTADDSDIRDLYCDVHIVAKNVEDWIDRGETDLALYDLDALARRPELATG